MVMDREQFKTDLQTTVSHLRRGESQEATKILPQIVKGIQELSAGKNQAEIKNLAFAVRGVLESFKRQDYVLMADLIEFEILPRFLENHE